MSITNILKEVYNFDLSSNKKESKIYRFSIKEGTEFEVYFSKIDMKKHKNVWAVVFDKKNFQEDSLSKNPKEIFSTVFEIIEDFYFRFKEVDAFIFRPKNKKLERIYKRQMERHFLDFEVIELKENIILKVS